MNSRKTILVGTDYSRSSDNAVNYAALLAQKGGLSLTLFHVYEIPVVHTYSGAYFLSYRQLEAANKLKLESYRKRMQGKYPKLQFETLVTSRPVRDEVNSLIRSRKVYFVVLGLETKSRISKFVYGTTGVDIAGKVNCPVIIVPESYKRHQLKHIVFAVDNKKSLRGKVLQKALDIKSGFKGNLSYVHIRTESELLEAKELPAYKVKVAQQDAKDFSTGIKKYANKAKADMLLLVSHAHSPLYKFFNDTNTKTIAFQSKIPVLVLHD